jgi:GTP-binding protein YchF
MILTLFGYPKTGKTLLFNLLAGQHETVSKFSASTNDFHKAMVDVPDDRLKKLADMFDTPPVYAKIEFLDTGAIAFRDAKSSVFLDLLRRADGLVHVVRGYEDKELLHAHETIDPARDIKEMEEELRTVDYFSIEKRLERLVGDIKKIKSKELVEEYDLLLILKARLEENIPLRMVEMTEVQRSRIRGFSFLSQKPVMHIINADETTYHTYKSLVTPLKDHAMVQICCGQIETELLELPVEDRDLFQSEYGLDDYQYIREHFIRSSYQLLSLQSFFTVGHDETKAWTVDAGATALEAAGKIHSDIAQGFIRAEVIGYQAFLDAGGFTQAKDTGALRLEGKEYRVVDGEIVHFRFNK